MGIGNVEFGVVGAVGGEHDDFFVGSGFEVRVERSDEFLFAL
jgi:hypothetical protein